MCFPKVNSGYLNPLKFRLFLSFVPNPMDNLNRMQIACKLTSPELQNRKATIIASLKVLVLERMELENGMRYKFDGSDKTIDMLTEFIKTERLCCPFFSFTLTLPNGEAAVWLELTGPEGAKEFILTEINL